MAALTIAAIAFLVKHLKAEPIPHYPSHSISNRPCVEFMLPVEVTAHNAIYDTALVNNNIDAAAFAAATDTWSSLKAPLKNITVSDTYDISVQLCVPPNGSKKDHLQIATHGLAFDKRYWDAPINPSQYSYVKNAMDAGYSVLTYDRLGTGKSDKPDAYTIVQAPLQLEILREISSMARNGDLQKHIPAGKSKIDTDVSFNKLIHVGHSFGSFLTSALLTTYPETSDGAVITGYILNKYFADLRFGTFALGYAPEVDPILFSDRSSGYVVHSTKGALQTGFFSVKENTTTGLGGFEPELLDYAYSVRQPLVVSETTSPALLNLGVAESFKGPVQFVVAEFDYLVCLGDCKETFDPEMITGLYPQATNVSFHVQQGTGHGLTMHKGANAGYKATFDWLEGNGL